jgi:hypothetical protein
MKRLLAAFVLAPALAACSLLPLPTPGPGGEVARVAAEQRSFWRSQGIASYTFSVTRSCFCPPEWSGPFEATVVDGATTLVTYLGAPAPAANIEFIPKTIEAVFDLLIANAATTVDVTYDPIFGFPASFSVDPIVNAIDDEFGITVANFDPTS